MFFYCLIK